jgi:hypothetical protein
MLVEAELTVAFSRGNRAPIQGIVWFSFLLISSFFVLVLSFPLCAWLCTLALGHAVLAGRVDFCAMFLGIVHVWFVVVVEVRPGRPWRLLQLQNCLHYINDAQRIIKDDAPACFEVLFGSVVCLFG